MSRSAELRPARDEGFTLLEVVVALGLTMMVMAALLPQLLTGLRSTGTANVVTQLKGVAQAELELMRSLPFHVAPSAGAYVDVLDRYYPDLASPTGAPACAAPNSRPPASWTGHVSGAATRCPFEPSTGAFYRTVRTLASDRGRLVVVVDTQFLSTALPPVPVTPRSWYDARVSGRDLPPSSQVGITVTVLHSERAGAPARPVTTYTQIADQPTATRRVSAEAGATALHVGSVTGDGRAITLSAGVVNLAGAVSSVSTVRGNASAVSAGLATGEQGSGAGTTVQAPPTQVIPLTSVGAGGLPGFGCSYACWGNSQVGAVSISAEDGLPRAGTSATPVQAAVADASANSGVQLATAASPDGYRPELGLTGPLLRLAETAVAFPAQLTGCAVTPTGVLSASGFLQATGGVTHTVESCAVSRSAAVALFSTGFAPQGVVRIRLERASARCSASATSGIATHDFRAVVEVWNGIGFTLVAEPISGQTTDPLAGVPLTMAVGGGHTLGDYVASWSSATATTVRSRQTAGSAETSVPGVVTVASQPVRMGTNSVPDPATGVALTLGAVSCSAEDSR